MRNRKKRSAVFIVIVISIAVHVLGGGVLAVIKIVEIVKDEPEFEAPPVVQAEAPPPPPPPPPTPKRTQRSMPRPQPLAAQNPQNMDVPAITIDHSALNMATGRGMGGGLGAIGGGVMDSINKISFFGIESEGGSNIAVVFDRSWSSMKIFERTRSELIKMVDQMKGNSESKVAVVYFGGREAGQLGIKDGKKKQNADLDPTKLDYWFPKGVSGKRWLEPNGERVEGMLEELNKIDPSSEDAQVKSQDELDEDSFFILGTQYWGALNTTYRLKPAPDAIYLMIEPGIAFPDEKKVKASFAIFDDEGRSKPEESEIFFILGKTRKQVKNTKPMHLMLNLLYDRELTQEEFDKYIVYDD